MLPRLFQLSPPSSSWIVTLGCHAGSHRCLGNRHMDVAVNIDARC